MDDKVKFCMVKITTDDIASYLSNMLLEIDDDFNSVEEVIAYLDDLIDIGSRDDFYLNVLLFNKGVHFEKHLAFNIFDTEEDMLEDIKKYDLHLISSGYEYYLGISDLANEEYACEMAFTAYLESKSEWSITTVADYFPSA